MSMRVGDEAARAQAEAIDAGLVGAAAPGGMVPFALGGQWRVALRRFLRHRVATVGLGFLVLMALACYVGARFAQSPTRQHLDQPTSGPSWSHWFGTDELSRDLFARVLHGGQTSLGVALAIAVLSTAIGVLIGSLAGFYGGWFDGVDDTLVRRELHLEVFDLQQARIRRAHAPTRWRGSSASRRPSPTKFTASTVRKIASPGNTVSHHHCSVVEIAPDSRLPQLAVGGWMPNPRNESVLSSRIASATTNVAFTMIGPAQFGTT